MSERHVPAEPAFGEPIRNAPSAEMLAQLATRRSASALSLTGPGPSPAELNDLLRLAARAPDHGKLFPWRFIVLRGAAKARFAAGLEAIAAARPDPEKALAALGKLTTPPVAVAILSTPHEGKIPVWEQELSAGAVCMLLLLAAQAMGYGANWITDWYSFDVDALSLLGARSGEKVAGFVYLGSMAEAPLERVRPDMAARISDWTAPDQNGA